VPYVFDQAVKVLAGLKHIIPVGTKMPVAFFAYPDKPSLLSPPNAEGHVRAREKEDLIDALEALADEVGARSTPAPMTGGPLPQPASGPSPPRRLAPRSPHYCPRMRSSSTRR
jgi:acetolactate synthase-1/2/3 large subunit